MVRSRTLPVLALPLLLAACGGGLYFGGDNLRDDDRPPSVSVAASPADASAGQSLRLVAAASDDFGVDNVAFYRLDGNSAVLLGADGLAPFQWDTALPNSAAGSVRFFARATDGAGQRTDSAVVSVGVLP